MAGHVTASSGGAGARAGGTNCRRSSGMVGAAQSSLRLRRRGRTHRSMPPTAPLACAAAASALSPAVASCSTTCSPPRWRRYHWIRALKSSGKLPRRSSRCTEATCGRTCTRRTRRARRRLVSPPRSARSRWAPEHVAARELFSQLLPSQANTSHRVLQPRSRIPNIAGRSCTMWRRRGGIPNMVT